MTLEKVRLNKNSKQVKFRGFLRLSVTFKIKSHKTYRVQIHRKHLSSPFCSQNRALTDANSTDRSLLEGMCHVNFWCFSLHARPLTFFNFFVASKKIFPKKKKKTNSTRFLGHHRVSPKYLKYVAIVYNPPTAWIAAQVQGKFRRFPMALQETQGHELELLIVHGNVLSKFMEFSLLVMTRENLC